MTEQEKKDLLETQEENEKNSRTKTELANRIARQSKRVEKGYQHIEDGMLRVIRAFSTFLDKVIFNAKYGKLVALVLAIMMYAAVNYNSMTSLITSTLRSSREMSNVAVSANYNSDTFEVSGLPSTADIVITGDASNVTAAVSATDGKVVADLEGLTEGSHEVKLRGEGFGDNVKVVVDPTTVVVTLKKKTTMQYNISYDFINRDKMDAVYSPGTPEFEYTKVNVRASSDTLNSIAFVKALIDVSGVSDDFEQDAKLIAYNSNGQPVEADIVPDTVHVKVPVSSPSKSVPIEVQVSGEVPDGKAIDSITMDQQTVTIYGPETALAGIENVVVTVDAAALSKDSTVLRPIVLPSGVSSSSINQVTMNITLGTAEEVTVDEVPINVVNNNNHYKASQPDNITTCSVTVTGTKANVEKVTAEDINVYIDMKNAEPGLQTFELKVTQPSTGLVKYTLNTTEYQLNVLGEKTEDTDTTEG